MSESSSTPDSSFPAENCGEAESGALSPAGESNNRKEGVAELQPVVCRLSLAALEPISLIEAACGDPRWSRRQLAAEFEQAHSRVYGVRGGEELIGFAVVHVVIDEAHLMKLAVAPSWQGRGVGRALLAEILTDLYWEGVKWAALEVRASNCAALRLYQVLGFTESGRRDNYYTNNGESAVLMRLCLEDFMGRFQDKRRRVVNF